MPQKRITLAMRALWRGALAMVCAISTTIPANGAK
jgi:hypothetical protein